MRATSPHWDEKLGVCTKHYLPQVPCPACMSGDGDEDVEFVVTEIDADTEVNLHDLVPANFTHPEFRSGH